MTTDARDTAVSGGRRPFVEADFRRWLGEDGAQVLISRSHDRYYAHCVHFGVAGIGDTPAEAEQDAAMLLVLYLKTCFITGKTFEESKKPAPMAIRLRIWSRHLRTGVLRRTKLPFTYLGRREQIPISRDLASLV